MAAPRPTWDHRRGTGSLNHLILCVILIRPECHQESRNEVGSQSPPEKLVGLEPGSFCLGMQHLNPLGHSLQSKVFITLGTTPTQPPATKPPTSNCVDKYTECPEWFEWGHCDINPTVKRECKKSCDPNCRGMSSLFFTNQIPFFF